MAKVDLQPECVPANDTIHSRRSLLGALVVAPAAVASLSACANAGADVERVVAMNMYARVSDSGVVSNRDRHFQVQSASMARASRNQRFWKLHAKCLKVEAEWEADPDESQEAWDSYSDRFFKARDNVLLTAVSCPAAVLAKLKLVNFDPSCFSLPGPAETVAQMIEWDLERCAMASFAT